MSEERKTIYLCLAHMSEAGLEQKYVKEAFDTELGGAHGTECERLRKRPGGVCQPVSYTHLTLPTNSRV